MRDTTPTNGPTHDQSHSATYYPAWYLALYDVWVLWFSSYWVFGCSISSYLLPQIPPTTQLTLMGIEREPLELARQRSQRPDARTVCADILDPLELNGARFDSVSMYYLLHCARAPVLEKCRIFERLRHVMTPDDVVHGATMLGKGYLRRGFFYNREDNAYDFENALRQNFKMVETRVVGSMLIFRAEKPKFAD
ncbi:uncharacterized protein K452DRAFT_351152 [Aplosporella prunicola CBS 121167]|uniref:Methyltransferase type 11 domain-containing protein n=1 Tax=Aplosporella prunicola CBS 121167 TaxID=1176127 RepID=A0A6A6BDH6_9PEZI|nr:uncharacterized protein K452DRAFT_351152 [Aplosporella prunicola CBS 121167]KAF2142242.1 hypothetical protein K452DRAFT_351152 [Aplosporella prunicola CBS 121167]